MIVIGHSWSWYIDYVDHQFVWILGPQDTAATAKDHQVFSFFRLLYFPRLFPGKTMRKCSMCSLNSRNPSSLLWMALELVRFCYRRSGAVLGEIKNKNGLKSKALAQQLQLSVIQSLPPPPPLSSRLLPGWAYSQRTTIWCRNNVKSSDLVLDLKGRLLSTLKGANKSQRSILNSVIILF